MIKPEIKRGKLLQGEIKLYIKNNAVISARGHYSPNTPINSIGEALEYIIKFKDKQIYSPALGESVLISALTLDHLFNRDVLDAIRRSNLFGDAVEILEKSDKIHAITEPKDGITYYEILGKYKGGRIMNIKISEFYCSGKILWTIVDIK